MNHSAAAAPAPRYIVKTAIWTESGLTADEVGALLEYEQNRDAKVYRIERIWPDGRMDLRGVNVETFALESGMFFFRADRAQAEADFDALRSIAERASPPGRAFVQLVDRGPAVEFNRFATALIYPAEYDADFAEWLLRAEFSGGDTVEGGVSTVTDYFHQPKEVLRRCQLWSENSQRSRSRLELVANRGRAERVVG